MFFRKILLALFLFTTILISPLSAQGNIITGVITERNSKIPVARANVYISGTTIGTTTDNEGRYSLENVPAGKQVLVVSSTGYESLTKNIFLMNGSSSTKDFSLYQKTYQLESVEVQGDATEWHEQYERFRGLFLGESPNADKCEIINKYEINFTEDEKYLRADVANPLRIINSATAFEVDCVMNGFVYDKEKKVFQYKVYTHFKDIADTTNEKKYAQIGWRRVGAYKGSLAFVIQSLIANRLEEDHVTLSIWEDPAWVDYYFIDSESVRDMVKYNPMKNSYTISFDNYMCIEYTNMMEGGYQKSWLYFPKGEAEVDMFGHFINPDEFLITGYLGRKGVADMLPIGEVFK